MKRRLVIFFSLLLLFSLVGCNAKSGRTADVQTTNGETTAPTSDNTPTTKKAKAGTVIAEGSVQPARASYLSFPLMGKVAEVLVEAGDRVEAGALLARLDTNKLELSLQSTEQDVIVQQAALALLLKGSSDKVIARADKANQDQLDQAEVALEAKKLQLEKASAEDPSLAVAAAQATVNELQLRLTQAQLQNPAPAVTIAEVALEKTRTALNDTQDEYTKAFDRPWEDQDIRDALADKLEVVQLDYRAAQAQLENAQNNQKAYQASLSVIAVQIDEAKIQLAQAINAQQTYSLTLQLLATEVKAAELNVQALKTWDNPYRDQALDEQVTQARAALAKAQLGVESLKAQIADAMLTAPFAGTVIDVPAKAGDQVNIGQTMVTMATLDQLEIRTKDLTELDIGQVTVGQAVRVTIDALPGREFAGQVTEISLQSQDYRGDVVYEVTVVLDEPEAALRWGMTALVEIRVS